MGIVIDPLVPADAPELSRSHSDVDNARYQLWASPLSVEEALTFVGDQDPASAFTPGSAEQLAVRVADRRDLVGDLYVQRRATEPHRIELGLTLVPGQHGRGLATAALGAVLAATVADPLIDIEEAVAITDVDNIRSRRLCERAGFVEVEVLTGTGRRRDGSVVDEVMLRFASA